jgi:adenylate cyclase
MTAARVERRLAAIMAADVVGYSSLMERDEDRTLARLKAHRREFVEPTIAEHRGRVVKLMGDGALCEFGSVVDAVACAVLIQRGMAQREEDVPEPERIRFRIGVNLGDVIHEADGDIYGDGVNVAARLEQLCEPGGVVVSGTVYDHLRGELCRDLEYLGEQRLKNIERPVRAYRMTGGPAAPPGPPALSLPDRPSVAVLPFDNMSADPEQEFFADGITEDLTTALSRLKGFFVIARNSSFAYKGKAIDVREVGRGLGVRYVLEGSVRRSGQRLRITAQLVEAATGRHLWADKYDGASEDVFDLQDRITADVVGAIEPSVQQAEIERARRKRPDSLDAYDRYLRALPHAWANARGEADEALLLLGAALALDPDYAAAHGLAAWCHQQRFVRYTRDPVDREAALRHARAALATGADDPAALALGALVVAISERDYATASGAVGRALAINPSSALGWGVAAIVSAFAGDYAAALDRAARAIRLNPLDPLRYHPEFAVAVAEFFGGRYAEAAQAAARTVQAAPSFSVGHAMLAASMLRAGRADEAREAARRLLAIQPAFRADWMGHIGHPDPAEVDRLRATLREAGVPE